MGGFFCCLGLVFISFNLLKEDLAEGEVFKKYFTQEKDKKFLEVTITISVRYSNIPRDLCSFQFM
jgi:hypothetical protein